MSVLDDYMANNENCLPIAKFLSQNPFLLDPSKTSMGSNAIKLWHMTMQFLLKVDEDESKLAVQTVLSLVNSHLDQGEYCLAVLLNVSANNNKKYNFIQKNRAKDQRLQANSHHAVRCRQIQSFFFETL
jgi:hypothetical protein